MSWTLFHFGRLLNRTGWGIEKAGAWMMHVAVERLVEQRERVQ